MSITVVIPTYNRPEYLATALDSVRKQTIAHQIEKIIVSENGQTDESGRICASIKDLNIEYIKQPVSIPSVDHISWIFEQSKTPYTAMLHDDDWWYPTHLEVGKKALDGNAKAVCYFSNFFFAENELLKNVAAHHINVLSYAGINYKPLEIIELSFKVTSTICFLYTPFHFSSIFGRTENIHVTVNDSMKSSMPYYADRILYPSLAKQGPLLFNAQPLIGVRKHPGNGEGALNVAEKNNQHLEGSEKILKQAETLGIHIIEEWEKIKANCSASEWREINHIFNMYFGYAGQNKYDLFHIPPVKRTLIQRIKNRVASSLKAYIL